VVPQDTNVDASLQQTQASIQSLCKQFSSFQGEFTARIDQLSSVCAKFGESTSVTMSSNKMPNISATDRSLNILLFGIEENRNATEWHQKVSDVMKFVAGKDVDYIDLFRLARFDPNKVRPILVKLRSSWDKRLLLSSSYKLKQYAIRVLLVADEPIDVQRKNTMNRLKARAEREGKQVLVLNGVLIVDNITIFALEKGYIRASLPITKNRNQ
jgi:hypothetical protein